MDPCLVQLHAVTYVFCYTISSSKRKSGLVNRFSDRLEEKHGCYYETEERK